MTLDAEPPAAEPGEAPRGTLISGFVHAQVNVSDLDRSIAFYEMLGFEVISKGTIKDPGVFAALGIDGTRMRGAFLRIPGRSTKVTPMIDMIQFIDPPPDGVPYPTLNHLGIARLCFQVDDIEAAAARLQALGVELVGPVGELVTKGGGMRSKVLCFRDPDGTVLEYAEINV
jgi:catechol 2,3-dioxygenase-like lactoylglutathione lyase family enzyme